MPEEKPKNPVNRGELISIAFELGFIIALPVVAFGFGGKWLDGKMGTEPMFTLIGVLTAIVSTTIWMYRKFKGYFNK